jgi:hypothetical protein
MEDQYVIMATDTILLGAVVLEAARQATVGQHHICRTCMNVMVQVPVAAMTRVGEAVLQTTGYRLWEPILTPPRQRRQRPPNDLYHHTFCDGQTTYYQLSHALKKDIPFFWAESRRRTCQLGLTTTKGVKLPFICVKKICLVPLPFHFQVKVSNHLHVEGYPHHITASLCVFLFCAGRCHNFWHEV